MPGNFSFVVIPAQAGIQETVLWSAVCARNNDRVKKIDFSP